MSKKIQTGGQAGVHKLESKLKDTTDCIITFLASAVGDRPNQDDSDIAHWRTRNTAADITPVMMVAFVRLYAQSTEIRNLPSRLEFIKSMESRLSCTFCK